MDAIRLSRAALFLLVGGVLLGGVLLGGVVSAFVLTEPSGSPSPRAPMATARAASLPGADVSGDDVARLPRYPGSIRTDYELTIDEAFRLTAVEYFAEADLDAVRLFYQRVISEHGWQRADITYSAGEWTYLLVDGSTEALIELEMTRGFAEIDIQVSEPIDGGGPAPTPSPQPTAPPTPPPPAPAPPPGDDDDDGRDGDGEEGDDSDDTGGGNDD